MGPWGTEWDQQVAGQPSTEGICIGEGQGEGSRSGRSSLPGEGLGT